MRRFIGLVLFLLTTALDPPSPAAAKEAPRGVSLHEDRYQGRPHYRIETTQATYWLDRNAGGLSRMIDRDGNDWIAFKRQPWDTYPESAASSYRGIPNLLFGKEESGFGHPGWDVATTRQIDDRTLVSTSHSGKWKIRWTFSDRDVRVDVRTDDAKRKYWFLYEGPVAGRWAPGLQYFATSDSAPDLTPYDYVRQERFTEDLRWAYFGDPSVDRVLAMAHLSPASDTAIDTFAYLGNSKSGIDSKDGMVVFGFGRGPKGIDPRLQGDHSFRVALLEQRGDTEQQYRSLQEKLQSWFDPETLKPPKRDDVR